MRAAGRRTPAAPPAPLLLLLLLSLPWLLAASGCDRLAAYRAIDASAPREAGVLDADGSNDGPADGDAAGDLADAADGTDDGIADGPPADLCPGCLLGCRGDTNVCKTFAPSNVSSSVAASVPCTGTLSVSGTVMLRTNDCSLNSCSGVVGNQPNTAGDTLQACYLLVDGLDVTSGSRLIVYGSLPLIIVARQKVTIGGTIELSTRVDGNSPGGFAGGTRTVPNGHGAATGGQACSCSAFGSTCRDGCGGGGGGNGESGGSGGSENATSCSTCQCTTPCASGGSATSVKTLTPLRGGGGGAVGEAAGTGKKANGGAGGGALQISSQTGIQLTGTITAGGRGGEGGPCALSLSARGGGGGGAGGSVLLEAPLIVGGSNALIAVNGGGGGGGYNGDLLGCGSTGASGGGDGAASSVAAPGGQGSGAGATKLTPGGAGGAGGAGSPGSASNNGQPGQSVDNGGGGGGGAVGRVRLNWYLSRYAAPMLTISGESTSGSIKPQ